MTDFFDALIEGALGQGAQVWPRLASLYAPDARGASGLEETIWGTQQDPNPSPARGGEPEDVSGDPKLRHTLEPRVDGPRAEMLRLATRPPEPGEPDQSPHPTQQNTPRVEDQRREPTASPRAEIARAETTASPVAQEDTSAPPVAPDDHRDPGPDRARAVPLPEQPAPEVRRAAPTLRAPDPPPTLVRHLQTSFESPHTVQTVAHRREMPAPRIERVDVTHPAANLLVPSAHATRHVESLVPNESTLNPQRRDPDVVSLLQGSAPVIHITIGRIEVRAITPSTPAPGAPSEGQCPRLSLDDYLRLQHGDKP